MTYSPFQLQQATAVLMSVRQRLLQEDPDIAADERLFSDMLEGEGGDAMDAIDAALRAALHAEDMADAANKRANELFERSERYGARARDLRAACFAALDALGMRRRELPDVTASVRAGPKKVQITGIVPDEYRRHPPPQDDLRKIKDDLQDGKDLDFAYLSNGSPYLQVTRK